MNQPSPAPPYADLLVYRSTERSLLGGSGVGPVSTSLDDEQLRRWDGRLDSLLWAAEGSTRDGFLYTRHADTAAMLRKRPVRDRNGRVGSSLTHALIGPADWLDPPLALALCRSDWAGWLPPYGADGSKERLQRVPLGELRKHLKGTGDTLAAEAREAPVGLLVPLAAAVLDAPGEPVTVVDSPLPPEVVLWALHGVLGPLTAGEWTFATRENSDSGPGLPRFVFVDGADRGSLYAPSDRRSVRAADAGTAETPGGQQPAEAASADGGTRELAAQLVELHRRRGSEGLERLLPTHRLSTAGEVASWQQAHQMAPGVLADVRMLLEDALAGRLEPAARTYLAGAAVLPRIEVQLRQTDDVTLAGLVRAWAPHRADLQPYAEVRDLMHRTVLRRLLSSQPGDDAALLGALWESHPHLSVTRDAIHTALQSAWGRGVAVDVVRILRVAQRAGLGRDEQAGLRAKMVERTPSWQLIEQVHRIAEAAPSLGRAVLADCARRKPPRGDEREQLMNVLHHRAFLAEAVPALAGDDPGTAVQLYASLVACVAGGSVGREDVEDVLALAGRSCPPALLRALYESASNRRARRFVERIVTEEYFRRHPVRGDRNEPPTDPSDTGR